MAYSVLHDMGSLGIKINEWKEQTTDKENFIGQSLWKWLCVQRQERRNQTIQPKRKNSILIFYEIGVVCSHFEDA